MLTWSSRRALVRAVAWQPAVVAALVCVAVVELSVRFGVAADAVTHRMQVGTLVAAAFLAYAMEDEAESTLASSPTSLLARRVQRLALVVPMVAGLWVVAAARAGVLGRASALEGAMYAAVATAVTAALIRSGRSDNAAMGGAIVAIALSFVAVVVPWPWSPVPPSPLYSGATARMVLVIGVAAMAWVAAGGDPARRLPRPNRPFWGADSAV